MFHEFNLEVAIREQYAVDVYNCRMILRETVNLKNIYRQDPGLVIVPKCEKTILSGHIFQDCKYRMLVKCIRGLIWAGLNPAV